MRIGGGRKPFVTPSNKGMAGRADAKLRQIAYSQNTRHLEAISIDAPDCVIYNKTKGSIGCTCTFGSGLVQNSSVLNPTGTGTPKAAPSKGYVVHDPLFPPEPTAIKAADNRHLAIESLEIDDPELFGADLDEDNSGVDDYSDLDIDDDTLAAVAAIQPQRYGDTIKCPVCVGATYVNAWQPLRGQRVVLEFSDSRKVRLGPTAVQDMESRPDVLDLPKGAWVEWDVRLPANFVHCYRFQIWNNFTPVEPATVYMFRKDNPTVRVPVTVKDLNAYEGNLAGEWTLRVEAVKGVSLTHVEMMFMMGDTVKGQLPQLDLPYDHSYYEYNLTSTFEFGADVNIREGDLIAENKYGRLWRATMVNRKTLADGTSFGVNVDVRVVQPKEVYYLLNPYLKVDMNYKLFLGADTTAEYVRT